MSKRIYLVQGKGGKDPMRLVEAGTPAQAIRHVAGGLFECRVATPADTYAAGQEGINLEVAGDSEEPEEAAEAGGFDHTPKKTAKK